MRAWHNGKREKMKTKEGIRLSEEEMKTRKEKERDRGQISQGVRDGVGAAGR